MAEPSQTCCDMETLDIKAPKSWNELNLSQLKTVARLIDLNLDRETLLLTAFCTLTGVKIRHDIRGIRFVYQKKIFKLEPYQVQCFSNKMAWLLDDRPCDIVNPTSVQSHLINIKFGSYFYANTMIGRYETTGKVIFIRKAMRELGGRHLFMSRTKAAMIQLWWAGVMGYLQGLYPFVFPQSAGGGNMISHFVTYQNLMLMLNENRPQDNKMIENAEVHDVLSALNNKIDQYEQMREKLKK